MNRSESIKELATALAKAQGEMGKAIKDANNPFFKSKYADLEACVDASRPALVKNGLSVVQLMGNTGSELELETILLHNSGEYISSTCLVRVSKKDAQGDGSGITYYRRYAYASIIGLVTSDDDGEASIEREQPKQQSSNPSEAGIYKMTFMKKYAGKTIRELDSSNDLNGIVSWLKTQEKLSKDAKSFLDIAEVYIGQKNDLPF